MLAGENRTATFLDHPPADIAAEAMGGRTHRIGEVLGDYRILSRIGAGGMGEVFLAEDTRLPRKVALKVLPPAFARNGDRLHRFQREAAAVSALNHPNIVTIHGIGESGEVRFIVTEYVEGRTLREELAAGPMEIRTELDIAVQVVSALSAAHAAGIVHRDIKPENVMRRPDGLVKVLDFGLAKVSGEALAGDEQGATVPGLVMGTPAFMSPEQARGLPIDARSDVFSFGALFYELLAGRPAFSGATPSDIVAAVLNSTPPPVQELRAEIPESLCAIAQKCLQKSPADRYQSADALLAELKFAQAQGMAPARRGPRRRTLALAAVGIAVALAGGAVVYRLLPQAAIDSVAVLPLKNEGGPDLDYIADGLTESLIGDLSQAPDLMVISRSTAFRYKGRDVDPTLVGPALGVKAILVGRVRQRENRLIATFELIDVRDGRRLWGAEYNRLFDDLAQTQQEISREVFDKLRVRLSASARRAVDKRQSVAAGAYQMLLKGAFHFDQQTEASFRRAIDYYQKAVALDSNYALAYAGLASTMVSLADTNPPRETLPQARNYALKALELDPALPEAHVALALVKLLHDWDWKGAEAEFRYDPALKPSAGETFACYLHYPDALGRAEEAAAHLLKLQSVDAGSALLANEVGCTSYYGRRYDQAISQSLKSLTLDPNYLFGYHNTGRAYAQKQMYGEAIEILEKGRAIDPDWPFIASELAYVHAATGDRNKALKMMAQLETLSKRRYVDPYLMAVASVSLGDNAVVLEWLEKAYAARSTSMPWLKVEPKMDPLRNDPRYGDLLRRIGLSK